jgi:hypothetical protein
MSLVKQELGCKVRVWLNKNLFGLYIVVASFLSMSMSTAQCIVRPLNVVCVEYVLRIPVPVNAQFRCG